MLNKQIIWGGIDVGKKNPTPRPVFLSFFVPFLKKSL